MKRHIHTIHLQKNQKFQATPSDWDAHPVKVMTAHNYPHVALKPGKHVFVLFCLLFAVVGHDMLMLSFR